MHIESNNQAITQSLEKIVDTIKNNGGWFDPNLTIKEDKGELSILYDNTVDTNDPIISMPANCLVPHKPLDLSIRDGAFDIDPRKDLLTDTELTLGEEMITLYNLCDKVKKHKEECVLLQLADKPDIAKRLMALRSLHSEKRYTAFFDGEQSETETNDILCYNFIHSRLLGQYDPENLGHKAVIMPIVGLINHHTHGAVFNFRQAGSRTIFNVKKQHITNDNKEIFVYYGMLDALDTALQYNFTDKDTAFLRSVPVTLDIGSYGQISFKSSGSHNDETPAGHMAPLARFLPPKPKQLKNHFTYSHLFITIPPITHGTRRMLFHMIQNCFGEQIETEKEILNLTYAAEREVYDHNCAQYKDLHDKVKGQRAKQPDHRGLITAEDIITTQIDKLHDYQFDGSNLDEFMILHTGKKKAV